MDEPRGAASGAGPGGADAGGVRGSVLAGVSPARAAQLGFFVTLGVVGALVVADAVGALRGILIVLVVALFAAMGLQPLIEWLMRRRVPRPLAAGLVVVAMLAALGLGLWAIVPLVAEQVTALATNAPEFLEQLRTNPQVAAFDAQFQVIDKLLFGSDFPFTTAGECIETLYTINQIAMGTNMPTVPRESLRQIVERDVLGLLGIHLPSARMLASLPKQRRVQKAG